MCTERCAASSAHEMGNIHENIVFNIYYLVEHYFGWQIFFQPCSGSRSKHVKKFQLYFHVEPDVHLKYEC